MGWSKLCRSERCRRTRPPRPVHGEQRLLQRSVTSLVMQITDYPKVISPLDFSVPGVTPTAFRTGSTACRVGAPDRRTHGGPRATWTGLVASVSGVTNGRSRAACGSVRRPWNAVVAHCRTDPGRYGRRARGGGTDRDGTVITLKRQSRHPQISAGDVSGNLLVDRRSCSRFGMRRRPGTTSAPAVGARRCHQFQLRTMRSFLSSGPVRSGRRSGSPVPVAHCGSFRSKGLFAASGLTSSSCALPFLPVAGDSWCRRSPVPVAHRAVRLLDGQVGRDHQFQLRIAASSSGSGRVESAPGGLRGVLGRRHAAGGMRVPPRGAPEGLGASPDVGSTVINETGRGIGPPPPSCVRVTGDTSVVARLRSADQGDEPRMNGRGVLEVRGCATVTA